MKATTQKRAVAAAILMTLLLSYYCAGALRKYRFGPAAPVAAPITDSYRVPAATPAALTACTINASQLYGIQVNVLLAIMTMEGGHVGQAVANANGTYDLGPMQINTAWVPDLARRWGTTYAGAFAGVRDDACANIYVGAWILKQKIVETGDIYKGIAYYHSATKGVGGPYADKVMAIMRRSGR